MGLETGTYISDLVTSNPAGGDGLKDADNHIRLIKSTVKASFPNVAGAVTPTHTELNYVDGVTSSIQTQLDSKVGSASPTFTGTVTLPATTSIGTVSATEIGYVDGVTSSIQTQLNSLSSNKADASTAALKTELVGKNTIWVPAGAMVPRTTNGAAVGNVETTTNKVMLRTLDFDTSTAEYAQFSIQMPKGWNEGTLICQFIWSHPSTTTNFGVAWEIAAVAFADDDASDTAFGTAVTVTDTGGTTNDIYITSETSAMTVAGSPGNEEYVVFQVNRAPSNGSDNLAVDARLHGVKLHYTTSALTDS